MAGEAEHCGGLLCDSHRAYIHLPDSYWIFYARHNHDRIDRRSVCREIVNRQTFEILKKKTKKSGSQSTTPFFFKLI